MYFCLREGILSRPSPIWTAGRKSTPSKRKSINGVWALSQLADKQSHHLFLQRKGIFYSLFASSRLYVWVCPNVVHMAWMYSFHRLSLKVIFTVLSQNSIDYFLFRCSLCAKQINYQASNISLKTSSKILDWQISVGKRKRKSNDEKLV